MTGSNRFANHYSEEESVHFEKYLQQQIDKIDIPGKDVEFLRAKIIEMYGNTVKNNLMIG